VALASAETLVLSVAKNQNPGTQVLINDSAMAALFTLSDAARCGIQSFEIFNSDQGAITSSDQLYTDLALASRTGTAVSIVTTIPAQDGTVLSIAREFKIKATASGGSVAWKTVTANIIVCGSETITLVDSSRINYSNHLVESPVPVTYTIASNFTSSDTDCPANTFGVFLDTAGTVPTSQDFYKVVIESTVPKLWLNPTTIGQYNFFVKGSSVGGGFVYREVMFSVYDNCGQNPQTVTPTAGTASLNFAKNLGLQSLLTVAELNALFTLGNTEQCLLETFEVLASDGSTIASSNDLYTRLNLANRPAD